VFILAHGGSESREIRPVSRSSSEAISYWSAERVRAREFWETEFLALGRSKGEGVEFGGFLAFGLLDPDVLSRPGSLTSVKYLSERLGLDPLDSQGRRRARRKGEPSYMRARFAHNNANRKVEAMLLLNRQFAHKVYLKIDEDVLFSSNTLAMSIRAAFTSSPTVQPGSGLSAVYDPEECFMVSPVLSSGVPTANMWIEDNISPTSAARVRQCFADTNLFDPGPETFALMETAAEKRRAWYTQAAEKERAHFEGGAWDEDRYWEMVESAYMLDVPRADEALVAQRDARRAASPRFERSMLMVSSFIPTARALSPSSVLPESTPLPPPPPMSLPTPSLSQVPPGYEVNPEKLWLGGLRHKKTMDVMSFHPVRFNAKCGDLLNVEILRWLRKRTKLKVDRLDEQAVTQDGGNAQDGEEVIEIMAEGEGLESFSIERRRNFGYLAHPFYSAKVQVLEDSFSPNLEMQNVLYGDINPSPGFSLDLDEVPLSRLRIVRQQPFCFIRNSTAIHPSYNTNPQKDRWELRLHRRAHFGQRQRKDQKRGHGHVPDWEALADPETLLRIRSAMARAEAGEEVYLWGRMRSTGRGWSTPHTPVQNDWIDPESFGVDGYSSTTVIFWPFRLMGWENRRKGLVKVVRKKGFKRRGFRLLGGSTVFNFGFPPVGLHNRPDLREEL
jgi:hypothetical protein